MKIGRSLLFFFAAIYLSFFFLLFKAKAQYSSCYINPNQPNACFSAQPFPAFNFSIEKNFETTDLTAVYQSQLLMDVDGDCIPEIIMAGTANATTSPRLTSSLKIINSITGATIYSIPTAHFSWSAGNSFAIADLDSDGIPEIVVAAADHALNPSNLTGRLICYNIDGSIKWISDQQFGNNSSFRYGGTVGFADFNKDGIPEVYIYNEIFNAQTGVKLIDGGANGLGLGRQSSNNEGSLSLTIAGHLDADTTDLELAAGYTIYKINITNLNGTTSNSMTPYNLTVDGLFRDGLTTISDINQDGQLDVIVASRGNDLDARLYCYYLNGTTPVLLASTTLPNGGGPQEGHVGTPFIGDIDGSGTPSIGLTRSYRLMTYKYNGSNTLQLNWIVNTNDQSGETGLTMFDFNQDGTQEIVYRDETDLKIINGSGLAPVTLASFTCVSGTGLERPIVGDIDNSGTSKICVSCGPQITGKVEVFSAPTGQQSWAPSRSIWNQYGYHIFNINDDLTVPQFPFNNASFANAMYNNFFVQASFIDSTGNFYQWAANLNAIIHCLNYNPQTNQYTVTFDLYNDSSATMDAPAGVPVAFFNGNPETTGTLIGLYYTNAPINIGQLVTNLTYSFSGNGLTNFSQLYIVVNTDGSQTGTTFLPQFFDLSECNYINNIVFKNVLAPTLINDSICQGLVYSFGNQNLSNSGVYYHYLNDISGCDSVVILNLDVMTNPIADAGNNQVICSGQFVDLTAYGGSYYNWSTGSSSQSINVNPTSTATYTVTVTEINGCSASDEVQVLVNLLPNVNAGINQEICYGDSASFTASGGVNFLWSNGVQDATIIVSPINTTTYSVTVSDMNGCSNTDEAVLTVNALPVVSVIHDTSICPGAQVQLSASGGVTYNWSPTVSLNADNISNPIASPQIPTTYFVTVTDAHGCIGTEDIFVDLFILPEIHFYPQLYNGCVPLEVHFNDSSSGNISNWLWNFGDPSSSNNTSILQNPVFIYNQSGSFSVSLAVTTTDGCQNAAIFNNAITVYPNPVAEFSLSPSITDIFSPLISFFDNSIDAVSWYWNFGDYSSNNNYSSLQNPDHAYNNEGTYEIKLVVVSPMGCLDSTTNLVTIEPRFSFFIPNAFTPNSNGFNDLFSGFGANFTDYQLYVFNRWGELIYETHDFNKPWNGRYWNVEEIDNQDVYVYRIVVNDFSGKQHEFIGHVTLLK
ncbi:MAG: PKD domain-containing protein [Bacteroidales bacterium]|nr:PKD domain-containing protein [Bacteroidales bacterium]